MNSRRVKVHCWEAARYLISAADLPDPKRASIFAQREGGLRDQCFPIVESELGVILLPRPGIRKNRPISSISVERTFLSISKR